MRAREAMHISIHLDDSKQWSWGLVDSDGTHHAVGAKVFTRYADAYFAAIESCAAMQTATFDPDECPEPIEVSVITGSELRDAPPRDAVFLELVRTLGGFGLHAALSVLNRTVPHRFTGVYLIESDRTLRNLALFDKDGEPCPAELQTIPLSASFCQFAVTTGGFHTGNSGEDVRLQGHWAKGMYNAYGGVPIVAEDGTALGTLCHFDHHPRNLDPADLELLHSAARVLERVVRPIDKSRRQSVK